MNTNEKLNLLLSVFLKGIFFPTFIKEVPVSETTPTTITTPTTMTTPMREETKQSTQPIVY